MVVRSHLRRTTPYRQHRNVEHWDDERGIGNSLIVTLKRGLRFSERGEHVRGFDTANEAMREVRAASPCTCADCVAALGPTQGICVCGATVGVCNCRVHAARAAKKEPKT